LSIEECKDNQLLFGYINFQSNEANLNFYFDETLNVKIPLIFKEEIQTFLINNCYIKNLKIKTISNLLKNPTYYKYETQIITTCRYKLWLKIEILL